MRRNCLVIPNSQRMEDEIPTELIPRNCDRSIHRGDISERDSTNITSVRASQKRYRANEEDTEENKNERYLQDVNVVSGIPASTDATTPSSNENATKLPKHFKGAKKSQDPSFVIVNEEGMPVSSFTAEDSSVMLNSWLNDIPQFTNATQDFVPTFEDSSHTLQGSRSKMSLETQPRSATKQRNSAAISVEELSPMYASSPPSDNYLSAEVSNTDYYNRDIRTKTREPPKYLKDDDLCGVCGAAATGSYYGGLACNPCKTFFQRAVKKREQRKCEGKETCKVTGRGFCSSCRYKRCLANGMTPFYVMTDKECAFKQQKVAKNREKKTEQAMHLDDNMFLHCQMEDSERLHIHQIGKAYREAYTKGPVIFDLLELASREYERDEEEDPLWSRMVELFTTSICSTLAFVNGIPGVSELHDFDKRRLFRGCIFDILFLRMSLRYDPERQSLPLPAGRMVNYKFVREEGGGALLFYIGDLFAIAMYFSKFKPYLAFPGDALVAAYLAVRSDRFGLRHTDQVERLEDEILTSCHKHFVTSFPEKPTLFHEIVLAANFISNLSNNHLETILDPALPSQITQLIVHLIEDNSVLLKSIS